MNKNGNDTGETTKKPKSIFGSWWLFPLVLSCSQALQRFSGYTAWAEENGVAFSFTLLFHMATLGFTLSAIAAWHLARRNY